MMTFCADHNQISKEHCRECERDKDKAEIERLKAEVFRLHVEFIDYSFAVSKHLNGESK